MSGFKDASFLDRQAAAAAAKKAQLERFRAQPKADDPAVESLRVMWEIE